MKFPVGIVILFLTLIMGLNSCVAPLFDQPQPSDGKLLRKFPARLRGEWSANGDTAYIRKYSAMLCTFDDRDSTCAGEPVTLSDSVLLKKADHYYLLNMQNNNGWWTIVIIEKVRRDLNAYMLHHAIHFDKKSGMKAMLRRPDFNDCDTTGHCSHYWFMVDVDDPYLEAERQIYYIGQFNKAYVPKLAIEENLLYRFKGNGEIERIEAYPEEGNYSQEDTISN